MEYYLRNVNPNMSRWNIIWIGLNIDVSHIENEQPVIKLIIIFIRTFFSMNCYQF